MASRIPSHRWSAQVSQPPAKAHRNQASAPTEARDTSTDFGCLLIPQFPVWAARFTNPALANKPLLIHRNGRVLAACPLSLALGVRVGWPLQRAQSLCPNAQIRAHNASEETHAWEEVLGALYTVGPRVESARPGLLFFAPPSPNSSSWLSTLAALAKLVRGWGAQAALASDRATAELAAHRVSPGTVRQVKHARSFLQRTPSPILSEVGLSAVATERLQWFGLKSVSDLTRLSREQIACQFADPSNPKDTALLWRFARAGTPAADVQPVQSYQLPPSRVSRFVFEQAATRPSEWESALDDAVQQASAQLNGLSAGVLSVFLKTNAMPRSAIKILREPVSSPRTLFRFATELVDGLVQAHVKDHGPIEVQAVEVRLSRLTAEKKQDALFDTRQYDSSPQRHAPPTLLSALRNIESRYIGTMWKWKLRDQHAPLPEERSVLVPALDESTPRKST